MQHQSDIYNCTRQILGDELTKRAAWRTTQHNTATRSQLRPSTLCPAVGSSHIAPLVRTVQLLVVLRIEFAQITCILQCCMIVCLVSVLLVLSALCSVKQASSTTTTYCKDRFSGAGDVNMFPLIFDAPPGWRESLSITERRLRSPRLASARGVPC